MMVMGREEEAANAHVTMDIKGSFAWTVLRDISTRRETTRSPYAKVNSTHQTAYKCKLITEWY